jgi:hypothetical protein
LIDRGDMPLAAFDEVGIRKVAVRHGAVHGEVGRVDLQNKPGFVDRLVFVAHLARDGVEISVVRRVIGIEHRGRNDARGRRGHEPLGESVQLVGDLFEAGDFVGDRFKIAVFDFRLCLRRALLALGRIGKAPREIAQQLGKFLEFAAAAALRHAGKA